MHKWHLTRILLVLAAGLALAAGSVAAVAATRDGDGETRRTAAQEGTGEEQPWLGIVARVSEEPAGLAVKHIAPESPAADSGIERGDVITAIDGQAITEFGALAEAVQAKAVGDKVTLSVIKNGVEEPQGEAADIEVTLEARPDSVDIKEHIGEGVGKLFDRFVDGQFRYLDEEGNTVTVEVFAGTVKSVSADEITLDVNGDEGDKTFSIPDGVDVPEGLAEGDRAGVVVKDGEAQHIIGGGFPFLPGILPGLPDGLPKPFEGEDGIGSVEVISGTVSSVSADEITLDLSGNQGEKPFAIPDGVEVPEGLEAGEQATVVIHDGEVARIVEGGLPLEGDFKLPFDGEVPFPNPFRGGPGFPFNCPCEEPAPEPQEAAPEA